MIWYKLDSSVLLIGSPLAGFPVSQCGEPWLQNSQNNLEESKIRKSKFAVAVPVKAAVQLKAGPRRTGAICMNISQTSNFNHVHMKVAVVMEWNCYYYATLVLVL